MIHMHGWGRISRRAASAGGLLGLAVVAVFMLAPVAAEGIPNTGVSAYVVATNRGPLPACASDLSNCESANTVWNFIHVVNSKPLTNENGATNRTTVPNTFVIESVDQEVFVNGEPHPEFANFEFTPPPNAVVPGYSGHWPATVTCGGGPPPCMAVTNPAVLPGENTVVLYAGWIHTENEPDGTHVFRYTVHGTLNGVPTDVVAFSKIAMTG